MAPILAYWNIYWDELKQQGYAQNRLAALQRLKTNIQKNGWGSSRERFLKQIGIGETLWVIGRGGPPHAPEACEWRLLVQLCVCDYAHHPNNFYQYRLLTEKFDFYDPWSQRNLEPLLRQLNFRSGKRLPLNVTGCGIGNYFQSQRPLQAEDDVRLSQWSENFATL